MTVPIEHESPGGRDTVGAVLKACALLEHFGADRPVWTLNALTAASGMNKTTVHRLMATLIHAGWVDRTGEGAYRIAMPVFEIGSAALAKLDIRSAARPFLSDLAAAFGNTAYLMVPAEQGAVCIDLLEGRNTLVVAGINVGSVLPYHAAAGPTVMLANSKVLQDRWIKEELPAITDRTITDVNELVQHLDKIREVGYSVSNSDYLPGVAAVAAPILGRDGSVLASISVGGRADEFEDESLRVKIDKVCEAGEHITRIVQALPRG
ncbi:IclR family transcriptional regulator [Rhodococcus sp. ABRD24]|uniref:IclR family transcriptional regulator n=1 Tax=Rhodococcus sp. ABRD24 TaxID=2507582 RepID=UPI001038DB2D|nr:IclR family transcriptional regulator [Rhodococcus sp. ABRD24]QBJ96953.1 IclR family transcriptional regulator [Rhodococcus sp. ABRD24]